MQKILGLVFVCLCLFPVHSFAFTDIEKNSHRENIEKLAKDNLLKGYEDGTFRPNVPVTRGQAILVLNRLYEQVDLSNYRLWAQHKNKPVRTLRYPERGPIFQDVQYVYGQSNNIELVSSAELLYTLAVFNGYKDGTLRPNEPLKRIHIASMLQKLFLFPTKNVSLPFSDVKNQDDREAVGNLLAYGITTGSSATTFSPNATLTRGQLASFIVRTMAFLEHAEIDVPVTIYASKELQYDAEVESHSNGLMITADNAAHYGIAEEQLQTHQYVVYSYLNGSGCANEIAGVTHIDDALQIDYKPIVQVVEGIFACTASVHHIQDILQFGNTVDLQKVTLNGQPLLHDNRMHYDNSYKEAQ